MSGHGLKLEADGTESKLELEALNGVVIIEGVSDLHPSGNLVANGAAGGVLTRTNAAIGDVARGKAHIGQVISMVIPMADLGPGGYNEG